MTDLERFEETLSAIAIEYHKRTYQPKYAPEVVELDICKKHIYMSYGNSVTIRFDEEGKFIYFEGWGE